MQIVPFLDGLQQSRVLFTVSVEPLLTVFSVKRWPAEYMMSDSRKSYEYRIDMKAEIAD